MAGKCDRWMEEEEMNSSWHTRLMWTHTTQETLQGAITQILLFDSKFPITIIKLEAGLKVPV